MARPDPAKADQIYELRGLLEAEAARACAERATPADVERLAAAIDRIEQAFAQHSPRDVIKMTTAFYEILFACAGKQVAWDVVQSLNARINHLRAMTISTPGRAKAAIGEMHRILDAIRKHDADAAYRASADHVRKVAELARDCAYRRRRRIHPRTSGLHPAINRHRPSRVKSAARSCAYVAFLATHSGFSLARPP